MRTFFATADERQAASAPVLSPAIAGESPDRVAPSARLAIYDTELAAPRVIDISASSAGDFIEQTATSVYKFAREAGGTLPYSVIREVVENFIHAGFREPVISILDGGRTVRFADQGPGISDKDNAVLPGFTTATSDMKRFIRGVGSGLPIVREFLATAGGSISIDDNLGSGSVVTLSLGDRNQSGPKAWRAAAPALPRPVARPDVASSLPGLESFRVPQPLSSRQKRVLALVMESGAAGPSLVARELSIALSTAHRDLAMLEGLGLIESDDDGKRSLTDHGITAADDLLR